MGGSVLIIECAHCHAKYKYDDERFERKPSKKIRCAKCREVFEIRNPAFAPKVDPFVDPGENTMASRPEAHELRKSASVKTVAGDDENEPVSVLRQKLDPPSLPSDRRCSLAVIDGPDSGKVFQIERPRMVIGRGTADIILNDSEISRSHAAIEVHEEVVLLEDLGSTNGTYFDAERIAEPVILHNQSEFVVGDTTFMLIVMNTA